MEAARRTDGHDRRRLSLLSLTSVAVFSLIAHGYHYFSLALSHDALEEICRKDDMFQIGIGRFLQVVYVTVRGRVATPWLCGVLTILWTAAALYLFADMFRVRRPLTVILLGALFSTAPATIYTNASYYQFSDIFMLAFAFAVLAVWLLNRYGPLGALAGIPCLVCTMGLYQAFFAGACGMVLMVFILRGVEDKPSLRKMIIFAAEAAGMLVLGGLVYKGVLELVLRANDLQLAKSYNGLTGLGDYTGWSRLGLVRDTYLSAWNFFFHWDQTSYPAVFSVGMAALLIAGLAALAFQAWRSKAGPVRVLLMAAALALTPFALNVTYFLSKGMMHELMQFSMLLLPAFAIAMLDSLRADEKTPLSPAVGRLAGRIAGVAVGLIVLNNAVFANNVYLEKRMEFENTVMAMNRVIMEMESFEEYRVNETPVAIIGYFYNSDAQTIRPGLPGNAGVGLNVNFSITYFDTYDEFFTYVMGYPVRLLGEDQAEKLVPTETIREMPCFPQKGYCRIINGVMVVKLSD